MHYPNTLKSKLPKVGTTIFSVMSKLAKDNGAINLSQGFPDFKISSELSELVFDNMKQGRNQYAPMPGIPELREELSKKLLGMKFETEEDTGLMHTEAFMLLRGEITAHTFRVFEPRKQELMKQRLAAFKKQKWDIYKEKINEASQNFY